MYHMSYCFKVTFKDGSTRTENISSNTPWVGIDEAYEAVSEGYIDDPNVVSIEYLSHGGGYDNYYDDPRDPDYYR